MTGIDIGEATANQSHVIPYDQPLGIRISNIEHSDALFPAQAHNTCQCDRLKYELVACYGAGEFSFEGVPCRAWFRFCTTLNDNEIDQESLIISGDAENHTPKDISRS